jgi:hypothetical protein
MTDKILLGYEIGTGEPVYLSLHHLAIFGMTLLSGKTTALEALITRAQLKAIAFITKRGEGGFTTFNLVTPYYKPRADWQFIEGLVNVALGEKIKYEPGMRSAVMKVCRGHKELKDIQLEARRLSKVDKSSFMRSVYERLDAYLEIVIPELDKWVFTDSLTLTEGINVMDLSGMRLETQHIVIASTIAYAFANLDHVVVIIPEAWETIPQGKMTPVKWVAQQFIRKGAAIGNFLWLDSQDIGGIDKTPLRQCDNWLMGRMKEAHEVERILKQLLGAKVKAEDIQTLDLGNFYAVLGNEVKKVYVLPSGVPEDVGAQVAKGFLAPQFVRDTYLKKTVKEDEDMVYKEKYEQLQKQFEELENSRRLDEAAIKDMQAILDQSTKTINQSAETIQNLQTKVAELEPLADLRAALLRIVGPVASSTQTSTLPSISLADIDERINQRFANIEQEQIVTVDVDARIKELVKHEVIKRIVDKIQSLNDPSKKAAWWIHQRKQASIKELYNFVYDKSEAGPGRVPGNFYVNVINPLEDAWLITNDKGSLQWVLQQRLMDELKEVLTEKDIENVPKYLSSLLL